MGGTALGKALRLGKARWARRRGREEGRVKPSWWPGVGHVTRGAWPVRRLGLIQNGGPQTSVPNTIQPKTSSDKVKVIDPLL